MKRLLFYIVSTLFTLPALADGRPSISITYYHYPPDIRIVDGHPTGKYIDQLEEIARLAGYDVLWVASTIDDEAGMLDDGRRAICTTGRMPTKERTQRWAFLPYVFDVVPGDIVLTKPEYVTQLKARGNITEVVKDKSLTGTLLKSGVYGTQVDVHLLTAPSWVIRTGTTDFQLMNMVLAGRAQYTIVPEDQWLEAQKVYPATATLVTIPDFGTHPPYPISIACSKGVPEPTLKALGDAMGKLGFKPTILP